MPIPGLKELIPSTPHDAEGLPTEAIPGENRWSFSRAQDALRRAWRVPEGVCTMPFGEARIVAEGADAVVFVLGHMVGRAEKASRALSAEGVRMNVIDLRTTWPLDAETILEFAGVTGRVVVVDEASPRRGMVADIAALVAERAVEALRGPALTVAPPHVPVPYTPALEDAYLPKTARIADAMRQTMAGGRAAAPAGSSR